MLTDIQKTFVQTWLTALRSGNYQQTQFELQNHKGYCCLGVACEVLKRPMFDINVIIADDTHEIAGEDLNSQQHVYEFFSGLNLGPNGGPGEFNRTIYIHSDDTAYEPDKYANYELASLNDKFNLNFDNIAEFLEVTYGSEWGL